MYTSVTKCFVEDGFVYGKVNQAGISPAKNGCVKFLAKAELVFLKSNPVYRVVSGPLF